MGGMTETLQRYRMAIFIILGIILAVIVIIILKKLLKRNERNKELKIAAEDKRRDENLNNVILNSYAGRDSLKEVHTPYDVDYSSPNGENVKAYSNELKSDNNQLMLQLIERTELSTRKFMLNPAKKIKIGSDLQGNDITVMAEGISPHQCEIFSINDKVYIRNLGQGNRTIVRRKKEQAIVDENGLRLLSNDTVILGNASYDITIKR